VHQKENEQVVHEENQDKNDESGSSSNSEEEMSFTSDENDQDKLALLSLIANTKPINTIKNNSQNQTLKV